MSKILFQLGCAFSADNFNYPCYCSRGKARINQYVQGFNGFFSLYKQHSVGNYSDIVITENTIKDISKINKKITNIIPSEINFISSYKQSQNKYGSENKGSGLLEMWLSIKDIIKQYEYVYYHEPRTKILNFNLYKKFLQNQNSIFSLESKDKFFTGSFVINSKILLEYLNTTTPKEMAEKAFSIEVHLPNFFKEKKYDYDTMDKVGVIWYDQMAALHAGLYSCQDIENQFGLERSY